MSIRNLIGQPSKAWLDGEFDEIHARETTVATGDVILMAGDLEVKTGGTIAVEAGGDISVEANAEIDILVGGDLKFAGDAGGIEDVVIKNAANELSWFPIPEYGIENWYNESAADQTHDTATPAVVYSISFTIVRPGIYKIDFFCEALNTGTTNANAAAILDFNQTVGTVRSFGIMKEAKASATDVFYNIVGGSAQAVVVAGVNTFEFTLANDTDAAGDVAHAKNFKVSLVFVHS